MLRATNLRPSLLLWASLAILPPSLATQAQQQEPTASPAAAKPQADAAPSPTQTPPAATKPCPAGSQPASTTTPDCKAAATKPKHKKPKHDAAPAGATAPAGVPPKTIVRNGDTGAPEVDLSPGVSQQQASKQVADTKRLLVDTDSNLKDVTGRHLNASQQETLKQIRSYLQQAKTAANNGDWRVAYNLAHKANLLSADLAAQ